ncbi:MAG: prephenate dehydratase [Planctomycetota bacterium]
MNSQPPDDSLHQADKELVRWIRRRIELGDTPASPASIGYRKDLPDDIARVLRHVDSVVQAATATRPAACFLGPEHSYSHLAALAYFGEAAGLLPVATIPAVFEAVIAGDTRFGIVPIENSTDGRVVDTLSQLIEGGTRIVGEVRLPIHHCLLAKGQRRQIREIQSKRQALSQCRGYLSRHFPGALSTPVASTAAAAQAALADASVAAVASRQAGRHLGLRVIAEAIEDNPSNVTRFVVLGGDMSPPSGNDKTSLLFQVPHQPGSLADAMLVLKQHGMNVTFIESFPSPGQPDEYQFFIEMDGHADAPEISAAMNALRRVTSRMVHLGSYARQRETA